MRLLLHARRRAHSRAFVFCLRRVGLSLAVATALLSNSLACRNAVPSRPSVHAAPPEADRLRENVRRMITTARDRVFPALVNIHVVTVQYWGGKEQKDSAVGSGTIISPDGYVVTNQHVTSNGQRFRCTLTDKREITAELVGEDPLTDLAVLKLNPAELGTDSALSSAVFGDSGELQVGDYVMAMGSPFALSRSVTLGIVSNAERVFSAGPNSGELEELELDFGQRTGLFTNWIQHDAAINPGNSGGPLVNLKGEIVGVNELGGDQVGFAIPSSLARTVVHDLIEHGEVPRSDIGVSFKAIQRTGLNEGVLINSVVEGGPADQAGIQAGDVLVALDDEPVTVRFVEQVPALLKRIASRPIGSKLKVTYRRDDGTGQAVVCTEKLQKDRGDEAAFRAWGLSAMDITAKMARDRRLDSAAGVLITGVRSGGPAATAEPPLNWGDVLRSVEDRPVDDLAGFAAVYRQIMDRDPLPEHVLVEFDRRGQNQVTLIKPRPEEEIDPPREVRKAWIGIATQPILRELAAQLDSEGRTGFRITRVYPGTRAAQTDLRGGDIIIGLNREPLQLRGLQDAGLLARLVRRLDIGDAATLTVLRDGDEREIALTLEPTRLTVEEARRDRNRDFDLTVRELTFFDRDENRWDDTVTGVLVEQVEDAGWAGLGGLQVGDLIQQIDGRSVRDLPTYRQIMTDVARQQPARVVFVVLRGVRTHYQFVEPDWEPEVDDCPKQTEE